jgi:orotate phosphoribosyltransferase
VQQQERKHYSERVLKSLHAGGYIETLWNTKKPQHQQQGWTLKGNTWSPWYTNLRPLGDSPNLVNDIAYAMNSIIRDDVPGLTRLVGIEMAGIHLATATAMFSGRGCRRMKYSYTRPLPGKKVRTPEQARERLADMSANPHEYGQKEMVEGLLGDDEVICLFDDMVTSAGSKLISRDIVNYELVRRGLEGCAIDHVAVVLDREQGAAEELANHGMTLHALIKFKTDGLDLLKGAMHPEEHAFISDFQADPDKYQDPDLQRRIIADANRMMGRG